MTNGTFSAVKPVVVIGGGLAGLTAAVFLAQSNHNVLLLERSPNLGGRAQTQHKEGFSFNLGPHAIRHGDVAYTILSEMGVQVDGGFPSVSGSLAVNRNRLFQLPFSPVSIFTTGLFSLAEKMEVIRFFTTLESIDTAQLLDTSVQDWVNRTFQHETTRNFVKAFVRVTTYGNAPELMSVGTVLAQIQFALKHQVLYLHGGWESLVRQLEQKALAAGVEIRSGVQVRHITRDEAGQVTGVQLATGEAVPAAAAIVCASPQIASSLVADKPDSSLARWSRQLVPINAACLDVALTRLPEAKHLFALGIDQPWYYSVHSATARLAPGEGVLLHVAKYLPPQAAEDPKQVRAELEGLLDLVQPGWREFLVHQRFLPEIPVTHATPTTEMRGTLGRPGVAVPDIAGLFLAGDWVGSRGLLIDASIASAKEAALQTARFLVNGSFQAASKPMAISA
ncbi:MAG: NAD(P)/FAD-dependent oxidoreductase [Blastocatellia bacterium]|nr:NAD(P)/FAD-dependent oxidoreductase [Blastocatellia bacterium]